MNNTLAHKLQAISPSIAVSGAIAGLNTEQVLSLFSKLIEPQKIAILQLHYPTVDARNHKSLHAVVAALNSHGMSEAADLADQEVPYIVTADLKKALQVYQEIQNDSVAVGVTLRFGGEKGSAAEALIQAEIHHSDSSSHAGELHSTTSPLAGAFHKNRLQSSGAPEAA